jgi:hypothetical protein
MSGIGILQTHGRRQLDPDAFGKAILDGLCKSARSAMGRAKYALGVS